MSTTMRYANLDEFLRYTDAADRYPQLRELVEDAVKKSESEINDAVDSRTESLREQCCFARQLLDDIEAVLSDRTKLADARADVERLIQESYFER